VHDGGKEAFDPRGEVLAFHAVHRTAGRVLEPEGGREAHRPRYRQQLLVAGVLYAALPEVGHVGAGHNPARGLVELLARPAAAVRAAVSVEEKLESLGYVQRFLRIRVRTI